MAQKIKNILVFSPLYPPHVGGLESHAAQWNKEMSKRGYEITVWTPRVPRTGQLKETGPNSVTVMRYPAFEVVSNYPLPNVFHPTLWHQLRVITRKKHDVVVSRTRFFFSSFLALLFARLTSTPLLHIEHGSDFVHSRNPITSAMAWMTDHTLGRAVLKNARVVVANSKASAAFVTQLSGRKTDAIIYRGVDTDSMAATEAPSPLQKTTITYIGRLIDGKGVHDLIDAAAKLESHNWQLWIIGDGPQKKELIDLAKKRGIENRTTFFGSLPWASAIAHLKASSIFVNPSYTEGLPSSVIEAALCQTAVIATNVGGTREIITNEVSGILVPSGDPTKLATGLDKLVSNPDLRTRLSESAYAENAKRFSWTTAAQQYDALLQRMLSTDS